MRNKASQGVRLLVPDGSLKEVVHKLLADAGLPVSYPDGDRSYQGLINNAALFSPPNNLATKMRPQDACWVVADGRADLAFAGNDLIVESGRQGELEILTQYPLSRAGVGKTRLVVAVPEKSAIKKVADLKASHELATEYPNIARDWLKKQKKAKVQIRRCFGSLEAFNNFTDVILENTETGRSFEVGHWRIIAEVMESRCCLISYPAALANPAKATVIRQVKLLLDSVIEGRSKRLLNCNVLRSKTTLSRILALLPAADAPTVSPLADESGYAIQTVVPADQVPALTIELEAAGARAIFDSPINRYVP